MRWPSARNHIFVVGMLLVATIGGADWLLIDMQRAAAIDGAGKAIGDYAESLAKSLVFYLTSSEDRLSGCVGGGLAPGTAPASADPVLRRQIVTAKLAECAKQLQYGLAAALYDADGMLIAASRPWPASTRNVRHEDFFRVLSAERPGFSAFSRPLPGSAGGMAFYEARRLSIQGGQFTLVAEFSIDYLDKYYHDVLPSDRALMYARTDGVILLRSPHVEGAVGSIIPAASRWYSLVKAGGGQYVSPGSGAAGPTLAAVRLVPGSLFVLETSTPLRDVLANWESRKPSMIAVGSVIALAMLLLLRILTRHLEGVERARRDLQSTQGQLHATLAHISQGVSFFSPDHTLVLCNRRYSEIYRMDPNSIRQGMSLFEVLELRQKAGCGIKSHAEGESAATVAAVLATGNQSRDIELADGRIIAVQRRHMPDGSWVATHEDITERRRAEAEVSFLARHDPLTGLANRSVFHELVNHAMPEARRGACFAVLFLDLDRFKAVNDTLGHSAGDDLLKAVAARLRAITREIDTIARFGGDEFVILQSCVDGPEGAMRLAERIIAELAQPFALGRSEASIGVSIGIAMAPDDGGTAEILLRNADVALYLAKSEGRGRFRFYEPEMDAALVRRHEIERDLRVALSERQFEMHYQPVVDLRTGAVASFEALIRWNHPRLGVLGPSHFIGIAEECGLICGIGELVLRQACRDAARWPDGIGVCVNLSPVQFRSAELGHSVKAILDASGLSPYRLEMEITETVLLEDSEANLAVLHSLRDIGVSVAMDDFGIGYSSLRYLDCFPFDRIKIDRSFVANMMSRREASCIVRAIIGLCHELGVRTTAEGIETAEQLQMLCDARASEGQGYFFSGPMSAADVRPFLQRRSAGPMLPAPHAAAADQRDVSEDRQVLLF